MHKQDEQPTHQDDDVGRLLGHLSTCESVRAWRGHTM
jgi:hypothetical protein